MARKPGDAMYQIAGKNRLSAVDLLLAARTRDEYRRDVSANAAYVRRLSDGERSERQTRQTLAGRGPRHGQGRY
jgi:hypothetical protein